MYHKIYENFKQNFRVFLKFIRLKERSERTQNFEVSNEIFVRDCIYSGEVPNPSLVEKNQLMLEHLQRVSEEFFSDFQTKTENSQLHL